MAEQGSEEWHAQRLGKVTASMIYAVMMKPETAGYRNYLSQLVAERLTGRPTEGFVSAAMQHGIETEPAARAMYEIERGVEVVETGFVDHPEIPMTGASPDGLVGDSGLVEIKCPQPTEHIRMLSGGEIQKKYRLQIQWQMACTGRDWCHFVSFNDSFPDGLTMYLRRVEADKDLIGEIASAVNAFLARVDETVERLEKVRHGSNDSQKIR